MNKIAIIKLSAMGDIIHSMVALQFIKKQCPNIKINWFVESSFAGILENNPHISNILKLNLKSIKNNKKEIFTQLKLLKEFRKNNYDLVIDAQGLIKSAIVTRILGKNRAGFSKSSIRREKLASFFYTQKVNIAYERNVIERNCKVLSEPLGFEISKDDILQKEPFLFYKNEDKIIYEYLKNDKKNILLVVGASLDSKMYSKDKFAKIASSLDENFLILWGNEKEKEIAKFISQNSKAVILPKLDLNSLKALVSKTNLVIGGDTGPTHIAWGFNVPSITLFGNTPAYRITYTSNISKSLESSSIVDPYITDKNDFSIRTIDENEVLKMAKGLLYA